MADADLLEPIAIVDAFATNVHVEDLDHGMRRLTFSAPHGLERHISAKIIIPAGCLITIAEMIIPHAQVVAEGLLTLVPSRNHTSSG
jgi:hypothetical protein